MRFLVTRPMAMAAETAGKLQALGHEALPAPMLDIVTRNVDDLPAGAFDAIILTSRNAVEVLAQSETLARYRLTPLLVVGERSARRALELGLPKPIEIANDVAGLMAAIAGDHRGKRLLYLRGADITQDLAGILRREGLRIEEQIVYEAVARTIMVPAMRQALNNEKIDGVLFYSARTAEIFVRLIEQEDQKRLCRPMIAYCLSSHISTKLPLDMFGGLRIAPHASEAALLALLPQADLSSNGETKGEKR